MYTHTTVETVPPGTITVGVDGSESATRAVRWAADQAALEHRPLLIVHAMGPVGASRQDPEGHDTRLRPSRLLVDHPEAEALLLCAHDVARGRAPGLEIHRLLRMADPRDLLEELSLTSAVLIVGSHGRGPVRSRVLGSVSVAVVRHARCPVVVIRPTDPELVRYGVLVGLDVSEQSRTVLDFAYRHASLRRLPLTVLHSHMHPRWGHAADAGHHGSTKAVSGLVLGLETEEERLLVSEAMSGMTEKYPDVAMHLEIVHGLPGESLLRASDRMHLVVVGSPAAGPPSEVLFGSIASFVVEHATCPVAVVPVGDRA